jgi:methylmalonyl-CoA mutase, C-terminal domain
MPRIIIAKIGLDGHDVGAQLIAKSLSNAGMEVIYTGVRQTPEMVAKIALQEDADLVGISILSGAHMYLVPALIEELKDKETWPIPLVVGGVISRDDGKKLKEMGVTEIFTSETSVSEIVDSISTFCKVNSIL